MLCFLPPVAPLLPPRPERSSRPRRCSPRAATYMCVASAGLALLTPVGWVRSQPVYTIRAGQALRLGPRAEDRNLVTRLRGGQAPPVDRPYTYFAPQGGGNAIPPGLAVDDRTGALVGTPSLPGTYTLAVAVADAAAHAAVVGRSFKVRVLPAL